MSSLVERLRRSQIAAVARRNLPENIRVKLRSADTTFALTPKSPNLPVDVAEHHKRTRILPDTEPVAPVERVLKTLELLGSHAAWWDMLVYMERFSVAVLDHPKVQVWKGLALLALGQETQGIAALAYAIPVENEYRAHPAAVALLTRHIPLEDLVEGLRESHDPVPENRDVLVLIAVALWNGKAFEDLEAFQDEVAHVFADDSHFNLFHARVVRKSGDIEKAAALVFKAQELDPDDLPAAVAAIEIAGNCPSDTWIASGMDVADRFLPQIAGSSLSGRAVAAISKLCKRSPDTARVVGTLAQLAEIPLATPKDIFALSRSFFDIGQSQQSYDILEAYLPKFPGNADFIRRMAGILADQARPRDAVEFIHESTPAKGRNSDYYGLMGHILAWADMIVEARPLLQKAVELDPRNYSALADLAFCSEQERAYTLANSLMEQASTIMAVKQHPQTLGLNTMHLNRIRRRMIFVNDCAGNAQLARALINEAIIRNPLILPYPIVENSGGDATGKNAIVLAELGIGDELRYTCVYSRKLTDCASVLLTCDPRLQTLLERSFPDFNVVPVLREFPGIKARRLDARKLATDNATRKVTTDAVIEAGRDADVWIRAIHQFEIDALQHPFYQSPDEPVLKPDPAQMKAYRAALDAQARGRRVVGLSWRGGRQTYNRTPHYFDITQWGPLLDAPDTCFVNLQYGVHSDEIAYLREQLGDRFIEFPDLDLFDDMEGIAALCSQLDMTIAICTNVLELAAAVGTHTLYLMRSPQATHALRLHGDTDRFLSQQDSVWKECRIIPRFNMTDEMLVDQGLAYMQNYLAGAAPTGKPAPKKSRAKKAVK